MGLLSILYHLYKRHTFFRLFATRMAAIDGILNDHIVCTKEYILLQYPCTIHIIYFTDVYVCRVILYYLLRESGREY